MFRSCSLHVSIVGFFNIRLKRIHGGSTYAECNSGPLKENLLLAGPRIVSLPRLARRDTIDTVQLAKYHAPCTLNWTAEAGRQVGREARKERGRMEDGREGGNKGRVGRDGAAGGREEGWEREWRKGGKVEEVNE